MSVERFLPRRWWTRSALVAVAVAVVAIPAGWASNTFIDVPTSSPHHEDVNAILFAGITGGCGPGLYCPADPVRRDQMATFLRRGLGRTVITGTAADLTLTGTFQDITTSTITTGGAPGHSGVVLATGDFSAFATAGALGDAVAVEFRIVKDGGGQSSDGVTTVYPAAVMSTASASKTWYFSVATGVNETFRLQARVAAAMAGDATDVSARGRSLTLLYVPFG
jgi:hypothetical protein